MNTQSTPLTKHCKKCGQDLPIEAFGKKKSSKDGLQGWCRKCTTQSVLEKRKAKKATEAEEKKSIPTDILPTHNRPSVLATIDSQYLADELRARGYTVTATKKIEIVEEL